MLKLNTIVISKEYSSKENTNCKYCKNIIKKGKMLYTLYLIHSPSISSRLHEANKGTLEIVLSYYS